MIAWPALRYLPCPECALTSHLRCPRREGQLLLSTVRRKSRQRGARATRDVGRYTRVMHTAIVVVADDERLRFVFDVSKTERACDRRVMCTAVPSVLVIQVVTTCAHVVYTPFVTIANRKLQPNGVRPFVFVLAIRHDANR